MEIVFHWMVYTTRFLWPRNINGVSKVTNHFLEKCRPIPPDIHVTPGWGWGWGGGVGVGVLVGCRGSVGVGWQWGGVGGVGGCEGLRGCGALPPIAIQGGGGGGALYRVGFERPISLRQGVI